METLVPPKTKTDRERDEIMFGCMCLVQSPYFFTLKYASNYFPSSF